MSILKSAMFVILFLFFTPTFAICQESSDLENILEGFEGTFQAQSPYGNIPEGWTASGGDTAQFSQGSVPHHGSYSLHIDAKPATKWTIVYKDFSVTSGQKINIQMQVKCPTTTEAQAKLYVAGNNVSSNVTLSWYSGSSDWRTANFDFTPDDNKIQVSIWLVHATSYGSSTFEVDCLSYKVSQ